MIKIYTPEAWKSVFKGSPSIIIDDNGYMYTKEEYDKLLGRTPCGKIEYEKGEIYGSDYANAIFKSPIGYIQEEKGVKKIYDRYPTVGVSPIYYIEDNKIYTADDYYKVFGRFASGYAEDTSKKNSNDHKKSARPESATSSQSSSSSSAGSGGGIGFIMAILMLVVIILCKSRFSLVIGALSLLFPLIVFIRKIFKKQMHFHFSVKDFIIHLLIGIAIFFIGCVGWLIVYVLVDGVSFGAEINRQLYMDSMEQGMLLLSLSYFLGVFLSISLTAGDGSDAPKRKKKKKVHGNAILFKRESDRTIFQCPFCGAKLAVPLVTGEIIIKCSVCGKSLNGDF